MSCSMSKFTSLLCNSYKNSLTQDALQGPLSWVYEGPTSQSVQQCYLSYLIITIGWSPDFIHVVYEDTGKE